MDGSKYLQHVGPYIPMNSSEDMKNLDFVGSQHGERFPLVCLEAHPNYIFEVLDIRKATGKRSAT